MGERLNREHLVNPNTIEAIKKRIEVLVDGRIPSPFDDPNKYLPEARFRIVDPKTNMTQIIIASIEVGAFSVEVPTAVDAEDPASNRAGTNPFFKKLRINDPNFYYYTVERGYYDKEGDTLGFSARNSLTEAEAKEFLKTLNNANTENEIDIYGQTREERKVNKAKSDILRGLVDEIIDRAEKEDMLDLDIRKVRITEDDDGDEVDEDSEKDESNMFVNIEERAKIVLGDIVVIVMRNKSNGNCAVDFQGDTDFIRLLGEDGRDQPDDIGRLRLEAVVLSEDSLDQRVFLGVVYDLVKYGRAVISPASSSKLKLSDENVATDHETKQFYYKFDEVFRKGNLVPARSPEDLQDV